MKLSSLKYYLLGCLISFLYLIGVIIHAYYSTMSIDLENPTQFFTESDLLGERIFNEKDTIEIQNTSKLLILHLINQNRYSVSEIESLVKLSEKLPDNTTQFCLMTSDTLNLASKYKNKLYLLDSAKKGYGGTYFIKNKQLVYYTTRSHLWDNEHNLKFLRKIINVEL